jgi:hypothetical protein
MQALSINYITGVNPLTKCFVYIDKVLFYIAPEGRKFNLPPGQYEYEGTMFLCDAIDYSKLISYPKREKKIKVKGIKKIKIGTNPNKCSIWTNTGIVLIDKEFLNSLKLNLLKLFVILHEKGHYYYFTESYCDTYAKNKLLKAGYNPSQIWGLSKAMLKSGERSDYLKEIMTNEKYRI